MSPPRVLITGAGGFVGSALAEGFAALGWSVTAIDLAFDDDVRSRLAGLDLVTTDLVAGVPSGLPAALCVIHAAAITTDPYDLGWTQAEHVAANTRPLLAMLEHVSRLRPAAFVFLSSSGVFSSGDGREALRDTDTPTARSSYAVAKRVGELVTLQALQDVTIPHVVRLGYIFGPHETARPSRANVSLVAQWRAAARSGKPLAVRADDPARDWTYVADLAPALASLVASGSGGRIVHLASKHVARDSAMALRIARHYPGATCVTTPAALPVKPPMRACDVPCLRSFVWTDPSAALERMEAAEAAP